jgi:hypothetical protein
VPSEEKVYTTPRPQKLGIKMDHQVVLVGLHDPGFEAELADRMAVARHVERADIGSLAREAADLVFFYARTVSDLGDLQALKPAIKKDGALWVLRPKGDKTFKESAVFEAGLATGLVDVKVVSFSDTISSLKFVHRLRDR